ncbi:hypothetical protein [Mastigocoleus testarum]|nr:hypothetical protein [Mastigocoleus testarum]
MRFIAKLHKTKPLNRKVGWENFSVPGEGEANLWKQQTLLEPI